MLRWRMCITLLVLSARWQYPVQKKMLLLLMFEKRKWILKWKWKMWLRCRGVGEINLEFGASGGHFEHLWLYMQNTITLWASTVCICFLFGHSVYWAVLFISYIKYFHTSWTSHHTNWKDQQLNLENISGNPAIQGLTRQNLYNVMTIFTNQNIFFCSCIMRQFRISPCIRTKVKRYKISYFIFAMNWVSEGFLNMP
jgi:hypothetical protein